MQVVRVDTVEGTEFEIRGLSGGLLELLAGVLDFPMWAQQPPAVGAFCEELYHLVVAHLDEDEDAVLADDHGMTPFVSVRE